MNWLQFAVQWLHVLLGIVWFGYTLAMTFLVAPALAKLPEGRRDGSNYHIGALGQRVFPIVALLVIVLGIIRGTFFGPIDSMDDVLAPHTGSSGSWPCSSRSPWS